MDKRYVNVTGGTRSCKSIATAAMELERAGFGEFLTIPPGPLMRSTFGGQGASHMPLSTQSTYDSLHILMDEAYIRANPPGDPDPEIDLQGLEKPLWGHHSFRRLADTIARQTRHLTGATEQAIDLLFGWMEAFFSRKMQLHYETKLVREERASITRFI
eukprot:4267356-Prymnesium_polylepis.2